MSTVKGISPQQTLNNFKAGTETSSREILRRGWNQEAAAGTINNKKRVVTPFRAVTNSGDFLARQNYVCGGPNQGNAANMGAILSACDNSGVEGFSGNPKFVADSSDYIRFRKLRAMNKNYNDTAN
tara:strand:+ start:739 stop:1116 length:378 start_codon:yes stop_codon:yes gene_type:complete